MYLLTSNSNEKEFDAPIKRQGGQVDQNPRSLHELPKSEDSLQINTHID